MTKQKGRVINLNRTERWLSTGLGALLFYRASSKRKDLRHLGLMGLGAALMARGVSGKCPVYRSFNLSSDALAAKATVAAPFEVTASMTMPGTPASVFAFFADPKNLTKVFAGLSLGAVDSLGFQRFSVASLGPLPFDLDLGVVVDQRTRRISLHTRPSGGVTGQVKITMAPNHGASDTLVRLDVAMTPPFGIIGALAGRAAAPVFAGLLTEGLRRCQNWLDRPGLGRSPGRKTFDHERLRFEDQTSAASRDGETLH